MGLIQAVINNTQEISDDTLTHFLYPYLFIDSLNFGNLFDLISNALVCRDRTLQDFKQMSKLSVSDRQGGD